MRRWASIRNTEELHRNSAEKRFLEFCKTSRVDMQSRFAVKQWLAAEFVSWVKTADPPVPNSESLNLEELDAMQENIEFSAFLDLLTRNLPVLQLVV
ncbi:unnamed protein product, partial [Amoebophrya sp. A120]|eukprot:GSA120T00025928001.1